MRWEDVPCVLHAWSTDCRAPAADLRREAQTLYARGPNGFYWNPRLHKAAWCGPDADAPAALQAARRAVGRSHVLARPLAPDALGRPEDAWVKVAYSPTVHWLGQQTGFFPGQSEAALLHPSPLTAMLVSGLLGAGLGWLGGQAARWFMPEGWGHRLPWTLAAVGGALGATPGLIWGLSNRALKRRFNDPQLGTFRPGEPSGRLSVETLGGVEQARKTAAAVLGLRSAHPEVRAAAVRQAVERFGAPPVRVKQAVQVSLPAVGNALWSSGASPQLAGATMNTLYAARQMPDPRARPDTVTDHQLGQLALSMGQSYGVGRAAGLAINALVGSPLNNRQWGTTLAGLDERLPAPLRMQMLGLVVPRIFGAQGG